METLSLGVGCLLGLFVNIGFAVICAIYGLSPWWLLLMAFVANLFAKPLSVRNAILERALQQGRFVQANFYVWIFPALIFFMIQLVIYLLVRGIFV